MKLKTAGLLAIPLAFTVTAATLAAPFAPGEGGMGFRHFGGSDMENVAIEIVKLENGVQITTTSDDADTITRMHEMADMHLLKQSIERTVTNLDNGVEITITSDNPDAVDMIQNRDMPKGPRDNEDITVEQVDIANGVRITITTDNADLVEKIQEHGAMEPHDHPRRRHGPRGDKMDLEDDDSESSAS